MKKFVLLLLSLLVLGCSDTEKYRFEISCMDIRINLPQQMITGIWGLDDLAPMMRVRFSDGTTMWLPKNGCAAARVLMK